MRAVQCSQCEEVITALPLRQAFDLIFEHCEKEHPGEAVGVHFIQNHTPEPPNDTEGKRG